MTQATFQVVLALTGATLSVAVAIGGLAIAPRHVLHRLFAGSMGSLALMQLCAGLSGLFAPDALYWESLRLLAHACWSGMGLLFSISFARFSPREHIRTWQWGLPLAFGLPLGLVIGGLKGFDELLLLPEQASIEVLQAPLGWAEYGLYTMILVSAVVSIAHLEKTLRASAGTIRAQIKFMLLGMGSIFTVQVYTASQTLVLASRHTSFISIEAMAVILASVLMIAACLRRRRFDVQLYVARAFPFHAISLKIAMLYLCLAVGGPQLFHLHRTGHEALIPTGVLWGLGLLIGVLVLISDLVRYESRRFLNRYIFRTRYDYRRIWSLYTQRMASVVNVRELCHVIARLVSDTFGVPAVTVWLLNPEAQHRLAIGGSTVSWDRENLPRGWEAAVQAFMTTIRQHTMPVDFASPLRQGHEGRQGGILETMRIRYGAVLVAGHEIVGMITLSERLTREPFVGEDLDLLQTIADQAAASLQNAQLSQRMVEVREMQAFQTVSTFFVHDLKNLAAKLSLMVQNLPIHYDNPDFRDDMLQVISKSVAKMNAMCSRFTLFTHTIELNLVETELNDLAQEAIAELARTSAVQWHRELLPLPPIRVDRDQIGKVLSNLLLNAIEAVGEDGEIRLTTACIEPWLVVTISDNGCGMSSDFLTSRLFEPFQTTKSQGLGIGMFHSKKIVEAHHGRIEAESIEGQGSMFRVLLPMAGVAPERDPEPAIPEGVLETSSHRSH